MMVLLITLIGARVQQPLTVADDGLCNYILYYTIVIAVIAVNKVMPKLCKMKSLDN